jgi:DNA ligase D-like protein (predicted 3'-phosphoesterase)
MRCAHLPGNWQRLWHERTRNIARPHSAKLSVEARVSRYQPQCLCADRRGTLRGPYTFRCSGRDSDQLGRAQQTHISSAQREHPQRLRSAQARRRSLKGFLAKRHFTQKGPGQNGGTRCRLKVIERKGVSIRRRSPPDVCVASGRKRMFVVQKHAASHLNYDFRLQIGGALVSWAVPKGPTLDPSSKRFATMTEDHPIEYAEFESVIPEGHCGAGTVIVWDKGNFEPEGDLTAKEQLARGELKFELEGEKLRGAFVLVHMGSHSGKPGEKSRWQLIKRKDQWADSQWKVEAPRVARSVLTGRSLEEIGGARRSRKKAA